MARHRPARNPSDPSALDALATNPTWRAGVRGSNRCIAHRTDLHSRTYLDLLLTGYRFNRSCNDE